MSQVAGCTQHARMVRIVSHALISYVNAGYDITSDDVCTQTAECLLSLCEESGFVCALQASQLSSVLKASCRQVVDEPENVDGIVNNMLTEIIQAFGNEA